VALEEREGKKSVITIFFNSLVSNVTDEHM
jgi:hypothetical protein